MDIESKKELKDTELEKAAAGDISDDVKCLFCGHKYKPDGEKNNPILEYHVVREKCSVCGIRRCFWADSNGNRKDAYEDAWNSYK